MVTTGGHSTELLNRRLVNASRLQPPKLSIDLIGRESVVNRILLSQTGVLVAPAGYGKTFVLARAYAELIASGNMVAWMSPPQDENGNFHQSLYYILSGLKHVLSNEFGQRTEALIRASVGTVTEVLIETLVAEITECETDIVLIIDDVHLMNDASTLQLLAALIRRAPLRLVLCGRSLPSVLNDAVDWLQVLEVRAEHLCLNIQQAGSYYQKLTDTILNEQELDYLYHQTEGWQAGIRLLASSASNGFIPAANPVPSRVQEYLDSVSTGLGNDAKKFMLAISILNYFSAPVAAELAGCSESDAGTMITYLCDRGVFIEQGQNNHGWLKFHAMFRDYLLFKLQSYSQDDICTLHSRAALWFKEEKHWNDAVHHAIQANDLSLAAELAGACARQLVVEGDFPLLFRWLDHLPLNIRRNNWPLRIAEAWANALCFRFDKARVILDELHHGTFLNSLLEQQRQEIIIVRAVVEVMADNRSRMFELIEQVQQSPVLVDDWLKEALNNLQAFKFLCLGEFERVRTQPECFTSLRIIYQQVFQALSWIEQGYVQRANQQFEEVFCYCEKHRQGAIGAAYVFGYQSEALALLGEFDLIRERYDRYRLIITEVLPVPAVSKVLSGVALDSARRGDFTGAQQLLERGTALARHRGWRRLDALCCCERARIWILKGELVPAQRLLQRLKSMQPSSNNAMDHSVEGEINRAILLTEVRLQLQSTIEPKTLSLVKSSMQELEEKGLKIRSLQWRALYIAMLRKSQEPAAARKLLPTLADWLQSESIISFAEDVGVGIELKGVTHVDTQSRQLSDVTRLSLSVEPINNREHEVLTLVAQGLTNKEVAQNLCIGTETVKWHLKNVFGKLQVRNRTEAVSRARRLSLIS